MSPIGSENVTATLYKTVDGHALNVGCWTDGTLDTLMGEVSRRAKNWSNSGMHTTWIAQYEALYALGKATVGGWDVK